MFPVPLPAKPIEVLVFVQVMVAPPTLLSKGILMLSPAQKLWLATAVTTGSGLIVILKVWAGPTQPLRVAVTEKLPIIGAPLILTGAV